MPKISVTLSEQEQIELRMLLADQDGAAALHFLKHTVWSQIQATQRKALRSHLETGAGN
jgi:hypothetical protein